MKKAILVLFLLSLFSTLAYAEIRTVQGEIFGYYG